MTSIFLKSSQNDFSLPGLLNWSHADSTQKKPPDSAKVQECLYMLIHWILNLYILISWYFTVKQYCVFVGGGGFGHQRFGMYPFSQVVPAYFVDVALSPKTASDISNLKSTILIWWYLPGKVVDFLWWFVSLPGLLESIPFIIFSEERVPWVPVQTIVDEAEIWRSTIYVSG